MIKALLRFYLFISIFVLFSIYSYVAVQAEEISSFTSTITINPNGTLSVIENIDYDSGLINRHGIYRTIPRIKTNKDGKHYILDFENIRVVDQNNNSYEVQTSYLNEELRLKIGDPNTTFTGKRNYIISYDVSGALTYFSDHDELYWNVTGNEWEMPITNTVTTVYLPQVLDEKSLQLACYTGLIGSTEKECSIMTNADSVVIRSNNTISQGSGLTVSVGFPKGAVAVLEPREYTTFSQTPLGLVVLVLSIVFGFFWYGVVPFGILYAWFRHGRDPKIQEVRVWYDPPKTKEGTALRPAEAGTLIDEVVHQRDLSATIVDLAQRGYFTIEERKKKDFYLVKSTQEKNKDSDLKDYEAALMVALFSNSSSIGVSSLSADFIASFIQKSSEELLLEKNEVRLKKIHISPISIAKISNFIYESLVLYGYFSKNPNKARAVFLILGFFALFSFNIPLALVCFIFGINMPRKTQFGAEQAGIARSLKNFLKGQKRQLTFQATNQMMFEKLLPYAVAFGVEQYWAKQFEHLTFTQPTWYSSYGNSTFNTVLFTQSLSQSFTAMSSAMTTTSSSSGFSSGSSGSSGGGGGGGGGGGW